jgi:hypothetical protein
MNDRLQEAPRQTHGIDGRTGILPVILKLCSRWRKVHGTSKTNPSLWWHGCAKLIRARINPPMRDTSQGTGELSTSVPPTVLVLDSGVPRNDIAIVVRPNARFTCMANIDSSVRITSPNVGAPLAAPLLGCIFPAGQGKPCPYIRRIDQHTNRTHIYASLAAGFRSVFSLISSRNSSASRVSFSRSLAATR